MNDIKKRFYPAAIIFIIMLLSSPLQAQDSVSVNPAAPSPSVMPPPLPAEEPPLPPDAIKSLPVERVSPVVFRIGDITINKETRSISFPAQINMDKGLLEYLIVQSRGKTHESLLRTKVAPYHLQIAFLLLGFESTDKPLRGQGDPEKPKGEAVDITITYQNKDGKETTIKAEEWVSLRTNTGLKAAGKLDWVYTGSLVIEGRFLAQNEGSIAAIYHDPAALMDNASAGGESDEIWFVKEGVVLPVGTPVTITIKSTKK